jgi:8-oxo-dGTP pyrophosphatase MutT (NUDIX family)
MKHPKTIGIQYAALPYRLVGRRVEVLLITSRETRRWVIPKGWPMDGKAPCEAAAAEALEEAGLLGQVEPRPIGSYQYQKQIKDEQRIAVQVIVFPFQATGRLDTWKEQGQREFAWFSYRRASVLVAEPSLRSLIRRFGKDRTPPLRQILGQASLPAFRLSLRRN